MALIGGFLLIGAVGYMIGGMETAMSSVAIFGLAGFKLVPALTTVQGQMTLVQSTLPYTEIVMRDIKDAAVFRENAEKLGKTPITSEPKMLELKDVEFTYPGAESPAVTNINLSLPIGSSVGIVGQSGAGKSTLIDIFLGLLTPSKGTMTLDGVPLEEVLSDWRKRVGYVPQDVAIFDGTVAQNVALSWGGDIDEDKVRTALERAQLLETIDARVGGIQGRVGERGLSLSGGQRQRLGIARALYMDPLVLVLDEATSALDTATEAAVANAISELHGEITVISVAHRLSTIRDNDQICFMKDGSVVSQGIFDEVIRFNPDFAQQAALAGLYTPDVPGAEASDYDATRLAGRNVASECLLVIARCSDPAVQRVQSVHVGRRVIAWKGPGRSPEPGGGGPGIPEGVCNLLYHLVLGAFQHRRRRSVVGPGQSPAEGSHGCAHAQGLKLARGEVIRRLADRQVGARRQPVEFGLRHPFQQFHARVCGG